jgi:hypothetical protein
VIEQPVTEREDHRPDQDEQRDPADRARLERFVDQLERDRSDQQARAEGHYDRDHAPPRGEEIRDERADEERRRAERAPDERLHHRAVVSRGCRMIGPAR